MSQEVGDARKAIEIARDYAERSVMSVYWKDVLACEFDEKTGDWRVVFEASPSLYAKYYKYEVIIDSKTGNVKKGRRIEELRP